MDNDSRPQTRAQGLGMTTNSRTRSGKHEQHLRQEMPCHAPQRFSCQRFGWCDYQVDSITA